MTFEPVGEHTFCLNASKTKKLKDSKLNYLKNNYFEPSSISGKSFYLFSDRLFPPDAKEQKKKSQ